MDAHRRAAKGVEMPVPTKPPARLANWRVEWFDRTAAGREAMARLVALVPITHATVRRRLSAAPAGSRVEGALGSSWPSGLDDLVLTVAQARRHDLTADLAGILGTTSTEVRDAMAKLNGNTLVANALAGIPKTAPDSKAANAERTVTDPGTRKRTTTSAARPMVWGPLVHIADKWELVGEPIEGGFGQAWPAQGPRGRPCWVKRAKPGLEQALQREIRQLGKLEHPNIVELLDADAGATPWLVVADCGQTLRDHLRQRGALALTDALAWAAPIAKALDYAHSQQVIHHDVNTGNIARDGLGHVRLLDFGTTADMKKGINTVGLTTEVATTAVGYHPGFVAPELVVGQPARKGTDQYSLAAVVLAALAGAPDGSVAYTDSRLSLSSAQSAVLQKAQSMSPRDRFPTCGAFVDALRRAKG